MKKIQFSLRTLVIVCLIAGVVVWFGVQNYMDSYHSAELYERFSIIQKIGDSEFWEKSQRFREKSKNSFSANPGGVSVYMPTHFDYRKVGTVTVDGKQDTLFGLHVFSSRKGFRVQPIEIEYDDASENEALVQKLKAICDEKKWRYEVRKVQKVKENG